MLYIPFLFSLCHHYWCFCVHLCFCGSVKSTVRRREDKTTVETTNTCRSKGKIHSDSSISINIIILALCSSTLSADYMQSELSKTYQAIKVWWTVQHNTSSCIIIILRQTNVAKGNIHSVINQVKRSLCYMLRSCKYFLKLISWTHFATNLSCNILAAIWSPELRYVVDFATCKNAAPCGGELQSLDYSLTFAC